MHIESSKKARGMTLIEALISLLLLSLIMVAFLGVLDSTSRIARVQGNIADSTENLRFSMAAMVRVIRMAGTGGIPLVTPSGAGFQELAIEVDDNTTSTDDLGGKTAIAGTDILRIRGVVTADLYEVIGTDAIDFSTNTIMIPSESPYLGRKQDLVVPHNPAKKPILLSLQQPYDISTSTGGTRHYNSYRLVDTIDDEEAVGTPTPENADGISYMSVSFETSGDSAGLNPGGGYSAPDPGMVYAAGFIDDMRFFIAENASGKPSLYRYLNSGNAEELVPNIVNLQVSLGCDINRDGILQDTEWFMSKNNNGTPTTDQMNTLREVRLSLVARSEDIDPKWNDEVAMPENSAALASDVKKYRHRVMTVRTGLRSHPDLEDA